MLAIVNKDAHTSAKLATFKPIFSFRHSAYSERKQKDKLTTPQMASTPPSPRTSFGLNSPAVYWQVGNATAKLHRNA